MIHDALTLVPGGSPGNRYGRRFGNHWKFVRYARENNLDLDFTTPPRRPDLKATLQERIDALDRP